MSPDELRSLLADAPAIVAGLEAIRDVDRRESTWTFDDVPVDSGVFGELVSEGVVESVGEEYRLADPDTVDRVLDAETVETDRSREITLSMPEIDWITAGLLVLVLVVTAAVRASTYRSVLRDRVVFTANDPYFYVYAVETGLRNGWSLSELPIGLGSQEPLTTALLLYSAEFAGGLGSHTVILAWLPVIAALATVLVTYFFACEVTEDRRTALASAFVLAVLPAHAIRTALGFVDHHAFDFFWIALTALGLVRAFKLDTVEIDRDTIAAVVPLGVGVAGGVLAWWAGTLLLLPLPVAVVLGGTLAVREDDSFVAAGISTVLGVGFGASIVVFTHLAWGWQDPLIVAIPIAVALGAVIVVVAAALLRRIDAPSWILPTTAFVGVAGVAAVIRRQAPEEWARIAGQLTRLVGSEEIVEVQSIFSASNMGWLFLFGLVLFAIVPAMAWGAYRAFEGDRRWLVASTYAWVMLGLAVVQSRYAGEFSPFAALFGGVAVVYVAELVEAIEPTRSFGGTDRPLTIPNRAIAARIAAVVLLICGLSIVMAPIAANNAAIPPEQYETAAFLGDHAEKNDYEYPRSYVFSPWSWSRMYNYRVNGEARSYGFAQAYYRDFVFSRNPAAAYQQIQGSRADDAYVVTESLSDDTDLPADTVQAILHDRFGSRGESVDGLGHYRALYASESGDYKAFRVVSGATVRGGATSNSTVRLSTEVEIEGGSFSYARDAPVEEGSFTVRVPYPGTYTLDGASNRSVTVSEAQVRNGATVDVPN